MGESEEQKALAKLTRYLDAVENSIAQLLKERAGGLFTSVSKTDNLKTLMRDATLQIQNLKLQNLVSKEKLVEKTLNIETLLSKKTQLTQLSESLKTLAMIHHSKTAMRELQNCGDYASAMELINETLSAQNSLDSKLKCLQNLKETLTEQKKNVQITMQHEIEE